MFDAQSIPERAKRPQTFRLDGLLVEPATGAIEGAGGREQVDPKVMAVLVMLAKNRGALVSRAQLLESGWKAGEIYDDTLTQCVYQLRGHLEAASGERKYRDLIKTLPKRGYLLTGKIVFEEEQADRLAIARQHRSAWLGGLLILFSLAAAAWWFGQKTVDGELQLEQESSAFLAHSNAIAVLPFINSSGDPADGHLSESISDTLRDSLASLPELKVLARRSSVLLSDSEMDVAQIGRQLGIGRVIEGRFSEENGNISLSIELVDTATGFQLWFKSYEGVTDRLMLLEREIARDLRVQFSPTAETASDTEQPTLQQMAAHNRILLARQLEQQVTEQQLVDEQLLARVIELYDEALQINPDSAEAHARLGRMLLYQGNVAQAQPHILRALELDPQRSETYAALGLYAWAVREEGIGAAFQKAVELNPNDADALSYFASWNWMQGNTPRAEQLYRAALSIDPLSLVRYADLGHFLAFHGLREDAHGVLTQMEPLFPTPAGYLAAARITDALGEWDEALAWALKAYQSRPDDDSAGQVTELLARLGLDEEVFLYEADTGMGQLFWQRRYPELVRLGEELMSEWEGTEDVALLLAFGYSALGRHEEAIATLEDVGMPGTVLSEARRANELHAMNTYIGALQAAGRVDEARVMASWQQQINLNMLQLSDEHTWGARLALACSEAVLGNLEEALVLLESLQELGVYPWLPWLRDWACFDALQDNRRYLDVVAVNEKRIADLRSALPATLEKFGVRLKTE